MEVCSEEAHVFICADEVAHLALSEFAEGDSPHRLLSHFSLQCRDTEQRKRSDKQSSNSTVCLIWTVCNYTHLF